MGHAGSDVEIGYKSLQEIERIESDDPLLHSARIMIEKKCLSSSEILSLYQKQIYLKFLNHNYEKIYLTKNLKG